MAKLIDCFGKNASRLFEKKLFLFDMDGTIYLGDRLFFGVEKLLRQITAKGGNYVFVTNNSSKSVPDYLKKLQKMGLEFVEEKNFFTSAQAAVSLIKQNHGDGLIYFQGTQSFKNECVLGGLNITEEYSDEAVAVLVGFDTEITSKKIENTCKMLTLRDLPYYATNPDYVCPVNFGFVPDCGSMCICYERATGKKPTFIGKPQPTMIEEAMKKFNATKSQTVVIGDRLYTDIAAGNAAGVDTVCVLSGEVGLEEVTSAVGDEKPAFVLQDVSLLCE